MAHVRLKFRAGGAGLSSKVGVRMRRAAPPPEEAPPVPAAAPCPPCPAACLPKWSAWTATEDGTPVATGDGTAGNPFILNSITAELVLTLSDPSCYLPCASPLLWEIIVNNGPENGFGDHTITVVDNNDGSWTFSLSGLEDDYAPPYPVLWITPTLDPAYIAYPCEPSTIPFGDPYAIGDSGQIGTVYVTFV